MRARDVLQALGDSPDVASLLKALHWTLDFEKEGRVPTAWDRLIEEDLQLLGLVRGCGRSKAEWFKYMWQVDEAEWERINEEAPYSPPFDRKYYKWHNKINVLQCKYNQCYRK